MSINLLATIPNKDARTMQPLPWKLEPHEQGKCISVYSANKKFVCSFWGGDMRHPKNFEWCTGAQMIAHANYGAHAMNHFPAMQRAIEEIYNMEDMPEEAIKRIEALMEKTYYEEMPPYVATR